MFGCYEKYFPSAIEHRFKLLDKSQVLLCQQLEKEKKPIKTRAGGGILTGQRVFILLLLFFFGKEDRKDDKLSRDCNARGTDQL